MQIGGFPTDSVTEDYLVTLRLRAIGFQTIYLNEPLSLGLAPEGLKEYITQRSRWCLGFVQICLGNSGPLRPRNGLTFVDRINLSETFLYWSASHALRVLALIIPVLFLLFGIQAVHASVQDAIGYFLPAFIVQMSIMGWMTQGRVVPIMADISQLLAAHTVLKAVAAGLLQPVGQKFKVTRQRWQSRYTVCRMVPTEATSWISYSDDRCCDFGVWIRWRLVGSGVEFNRAILE